MLMLITFLNLIQTQEENGFQPRMLKRSMMMLGFEEYFKQILLFWNYLMKIINTLIFLQNLNITKYINRTFNNISKFRPAFRRKEKH
jgi:hypothetical protein